MTKYEILHGDCIEKMKDLIERGIQVDAIITDPPYEIGFMGKNWDSTGIAFDIKTWKLAYQCLKPGGYLLAFSATRTYHRMVVAIEDAGFEIRDQLAWVFASGFPKSQNVQNQIEKKIPNVDGSKFVGWGSALKPAYEPICMARKPLSEQTLVENVLKHGTGAINIDACRIPVENAEGRWPATLIHDGSDEVEEEFAKYGVRQSGTSNGDASVGQSGDITPLRRGKLISRSDTGTASRFFYSAKASKEDRCGSKHPTVKPLALMSWLVNLVTPPGGTVLDIFSGSGTTGHAALKNGFNVILIEREAEYVADIKRRLEIFGLLEF